MRRPALPALLSVVLAAVALSACGRESAREGDRPQIGARGEAPEAATDLGFPAFATKNTTRIGGADAVANAAAVARAVYPATDASSRPAAVVLVDRADWRSAIAAAALMAEPIGAPVLFADGDELPPATEQALAALQPTGSEPIDDAQVIRIGDVPRPEGLRSADVTGENPAAIARAIAGLLAEARGETPEQALVVSSDDQDFAAPAAAWAAKSGDPVLFVGGEGEVPAATRAALSALRQPRIYLLGPSAVVDPGVRRGLSRLGRVTRMGGADPVTNAIEFARFRDGSFGWGVSDPGHGFVFVRTGRPLDAVAAAPLSASGTYGPLLLVDGAQRLPRPLEQYLLDVQPGFTEDPVRGVYNRGWLIGDAEAITVGLQARIDALLEIVAVEIPDEMPDDETAESVPEDDDSEDEPETDDDLPTETQPAPDAPADAIPPTQTETTP